MEQRRRLWSASLMLVAAVFLAITAAFGVPAGTAQAAQSVPYLINFQGRLTDNSGNILTDGSYNIRFRIMNAATNGTNLWQANRTFTTGDNRISVVNGLFNIQFGDTTKGDPAFPAGLFDTQQNPSLYLEVELPTPATATCSSNGCAAFTEGAMSPRQPFASAPYAFNSDTLDGLDATAFTQLAASNTFTGANLFAPTAASAVGLTVKGTSSTTTGNVFEIYNAGSSQSLQGYFNAAGSLNVAQVIQPTSNNAIDLGVTGAAFRNVYAATFDTGTTTTALNIGNTNAASITIGKSGVAVSAPGGLNTSNGAINAGSGAISTTGTLGAGAATVTSLSAGSGTIGTTGAVNGGTITATTAFVGPLLQTADQTASASTAIVVRSGNVSGGTSLTTGTLTLSTGNNTGTTGSSGVLTLSSGTGTNASGNVAITSGSATTTSGNVTIDVGGTATTKGSITLGSTNASALTLGRSGLSVSIPGGLTTTNGAISTGTGNITSTGTVSGATVTATSGFSANGTAGVGSTCGAGQALTGSTYTMGLVTTAGTCAAVGAAGAIVQAPTSTAANTIAPATASVVALTVKGTSNATTANVMEVYNAGTTQSLQAYFNAAGNLNVAQTIQPTSNNTVDVGLAGTAFKNVYAANFDTGTTTTALTLGTSNAASITIGKTGVAVSAPGGLTTSGGAINAGTGAVSTTGTLTAGGDIVNVHQQTINLTRTLPTTVNNTVDIGTTTLTNTNAAFNIKIAATSGCFAVTKTYDFVVIYNATANTWQRVQPANDSGAFCANDFGLEVNTPTTNSITMRLRRTAGTDAGVVNITMVRQSQVADTFTPSTTVTTGAAVVTAYLSNSNLTQAGANVGIGTTTPAYKLDVAGDINTSGTFRGSGVNLTNLNPSNLVTGTGAVTLQPAASTALNLTATGTGAINITAGTGGVVNSVGSGVTTSYTATAAQTADMMTLQNTSAFSSTAEGMNLIQQTFFGKPASGNTQSSTRINVTNVNTAAGGQINGLRITATGAGGAIASDTAGLVIDNYSNASTGTASENAIEIGTGWDAGFYIQSGGNSIIATSTTALTVANASSLAALSVDTSGNKVQIGSATSDANQILLQVDSYQVSTTSVADTATCAATTNQGALYYNMTTNAIRGCIGGAWEDVVSTAGLGIIAYGVIGDTGANPGDIASLTTSGVTGPCKVSWTSASSVTVAPCALFSSGRKMIVPSAVTLTMSGFATSSYAYVCMNPTTGAPYITTPGTAETTSGLPAFSISAPVLCLAQIRNSTTATNSIAQLYDIRTFTNTSKVWVALTTNLPSLGQLVAPNGTTPTLSSQSANTGNLGTITGVVVASSGAASTGAPNGIVATLGPQYVKAVGGTAGAWATSATTAGYITSTGTAAFSNLGTLKTTFNATNPCTSAAICQQSVLVDFRGK